MYRSSLLSQKRSLSLWNSAVASVKAKQRKSLSSLTRTTFSKHMQANRASSNASSVHQRNFRFEKGGQWRCLSSESNQQSKQKAEGGKEEDPGSEIMLTPGEKVVAASRLTMWAGIFAFACACAYYIGKELIPTKMSANRIFDAALAIIREDPEVRRRFGESLKGYGRDHGGSREGRRNFVEHSEYKSEDDGSKRTRVRFNLEGQFGNAFCFAEQSSEMPGGEFVYVLVQDKANGRVITVVDNRHKMAAARMAGGSKEGQEAFGNLLTGGKK
mmetsp:Transcript_11989/g.16764  ORF Transcript_11989/g.16764 Transcript_11989/m.16764 type:complete len:272 (+) Transcript_11989:140-955(+)